MKNKEFLTICYQAFNRFITAEEFIEMLSNMNKDSLSKQEREKIDQLLNEIKTISSNIQNEEDEYVIKRKESIKKHIDILETIPRNKENEEFLNKRLQDLTDDYHRPMDSYKRWHTITECIEKNDYYNACFHQLSKYELLEFIAQYIQVPYPPQLTQEEFESLVQVGIEQDKREWLWRLAFNYEKSNINFDSIVDYFIEKKDGYYLAELVCAIGECLDIDAMIDKINDKELIEDLKGRKSVLDVYVSEEQFQKLFDK